MSYQDINEVSAETTQAFAADLYGAYQDINDVPTDTTQTSADMSALLLSSGAHTGTQESKELGADGPRRFLGEGAFGKVYQATLQGQQVALKTMSLKQLEALQRKANEQLATAQETKHLQWLKGTVASFMWEARRLQSVSHPFMVGLQRPPLHIDHELVLVLEFCGGGDLEHAIANPQHNVHQVSTQWRLLVQLATALQVVHSKGMVHKDLKSENCLLTSEGDLKLADLGVAAVDASLLAEQKESSIAVVESGMKDLYWASPEEARRMLNIDQSVSLTPKLDVFAVGLIGVHLLTSSFPWQLATDSHTKSKEVRTSWLTQLAQGQVRDKLNQALLQRAGKHPLCEILTNCLESNPEQRPSVDELLSKLLHPDLVAQCFDQDSLAAAQALVRYHHTMLLHESQTERARYLPPWTTRNPTLERVPEDHKFESQAALPAAVTKFIQESTEQVLLVLGDGGTGKTLSSHVLAAQCDQVLFVRPGFAQWSHRELEQGLDTSLRRFYGLSDPMVQALRANNPVFWFDAYDELSDDVHGTFRNLRDVLGLAQNRLVVTCRRQTVPHADLHQRFGDDTHVLYVLPFSSQQIVKYLETNEVQGAAQLDRGTLRIIEVPFVLRLYCNTHVGQAAASVRHSSEVYQAAVTKWATDANARLNRLPRTITQAVTQSLLDNEYPTLLESFELFARGVAVDMWRAGVTAVQVSAAQPWVRASQVVKTAATAAYQASGTEQRLVQPDAYVNLQLVQWQQHVLAGCPLVCKTGDMWSFVHKSFRDFYIAQALVHHVPLDVNSALQHPLAIKPVTADVAVQKTAAEFVDVVLARRSGDDSPEKSVAFLQADDQKQKSHDQRLETAAWGLVQLTKTHPALNVVAANCLTILNTAGVPMAGRSFAGCHLGDEKWDQEYPFLDLGAAHLHSADLTDTVLCGARLQQACLDRAQLVRTNLLHTVWGELATLTGHTKDVCALAITRDGRTLYSASDDQTVRKWDLASGTCTQTLAGHTGVVSMLVLARDGSTLYSGSGDKSIKQWNLASGTCTRTLTGHTGVVKSLVLTRDGRTLYSGSADNTIKQWDLASGTCTRTLTGDAYRKNDGINALVLSRDERTLYSASDGLRQWDLASGSCTRTLFEHDCWIYALALARDGRTLYSSARDEISQWDLASGTRTRSLTGHIEGVYALVLARDGHTLYSASWDRTVKRWDLASGTCTRTLTGHAKEVTALALPHNGSTLYSASKDHTVKQWDLASGTCPRILSGHADRVCALALACDGRTLFSSSMDYTVKQWDLALGACTRTLTGHTQWVYALALARDGRTLYSASYDHTIKQWDLVSGTCTCTLTGHTDAIVALVLAQDNRTLYSASRDQTVKQWNVPSDPTPTPISWRHFGPVDPPERAPDGSLLSSCTRTFTGHTDAVEALVLSCDGSTLYSGAMDQTIKQWDLASGTCKRTLTGHTGAVFALALDGHTMYSASDDQTAKQWDLPSGTCVRTEERDKFTLPADVQWTGEPSVSNGTVQCEFTRYNVKVSRSPIVLWQSSPYSLSASGTQVQDVQCSAPVRQLLRSLTV